MATRIVDYCLLQVDEQWFLITGYEPGKDSIKLSRLLDFGPGKQRKGMVIGLSDKWESMLAEEINQIVYPSYGFAVGDNLRSRLNLLPGKHTVRLSVILDPTRARNEPVQIYSNPVEIEILPEEKTGIDVAGGDISIDEIPIERIRKCLPNDWYINHVEPTHTVSGCMKLKGSKGITLVFSRCPTDTALKKNKAGGLHVRVPSFSIDVFPLDFEGQNMVNEGIFRQGKIIGPKKDLWPERAVLPRKHFKRIKDWYIFYNDESFVDDILLEIEASMEVQEEKEFLQKFFTYIDNGIGNLVPQYPQLVDWNTEKIKPQWRSAGEKLTDRTLIYSHALTDSKSFNYKDWYGQNGCHIRINVVTEEEWIRVSGPAVKTKIFGLQLGEFFVIAQVVTENPKVPELEQKINNIIRSAVIEATENLTVQVEGKRLIN